MTVNGAHTTTVMTGRRVFIVEDEAVVASFEKNIVEALGCEVIGISSTGEEGVEMVSRDKPDLVIMDLTLAGKMNGFEAAGEIIEEHGVPVVFVTAYKPKGSFIHDGTDGVIGYVVKPFIKQKLEAYVEVALGGISEKLEQGHAEI